ncbi:MAG: iron complex outermembrane receptor protein [Bacteroidia bacterium]
MPYSMEPESLSLRSIGFTLLLLSCWSVELRAQDQGASGNNSKTDQSGAEAQRVVPAVDPRLEEVMVTATKRSASARDLPISIDAFDAEDLVARGADSLAEILKYSPGVTLATNDSPDDNYISIRGVSSDSRNALFGRPSGLFYGDIPLINPSLQAVAPDVDPYDLATVEVLKGPQGTLFGGSALSGAVRYMPNAPDFEDSYGHVSAGVGSVEYSKGLNSQYMGSFNHAITDTLAYRIVGSVRERAGYIDNTRNGEEDINSSETEQGRVIIAWQPTDWLQLEYTHFQRRVESGNGGRLSDHKNYEVDNRYVDGFADSEVQLGALEMELDLGSYTLTGVFANLKKDGINKLDLTAALGQGEVGNLVALPLGLGATTPGTTSFQHYVSAVEQPTQELRITSNDVTEGGWLLGDWEVLLGVFNFESKQFFDLVTMEDPAGGDDPGAATVAKLQSVFDITATERAVFFDVTRLFSDYWKLNLGGRYYEQKTEGTSDSYANGALVPSPNPVRVEQSEYGFTPKLALTWLPSDRFSVFGSAVKGFRFGGFNALDDLTANALALPRTYDSDSLWNYELGFRSDWLDGRLKFDVTAFFVDWDNLQIQQLAQGAFAYTDNVGAAEVKGVEAGLRWLLPKGLFLVVNGAHIDSRTAEDFESQETGGTVPAGTRLPNTPYVTGSIVLSHSGQLGAWLANSSYSIAYSGAPVNTLADNYELRSHTTHGASINFVNQKSRFEPSIGISATNLLSEKALVFALYAGVPAQLFGGALAPRTISINFGIKF